LKNAIAKVLSIFGSRNAVVKGFLSGLRKEVEDEGLSRLGTSTT
jgi:hypothetical protein